MLTIQEKDLVRIIIADQINGLNDTDAITKVMSDYASLSDDEIRAKIAEYKSQKIAELTDLSDCLAQQKSDVDKQISDLML